MMAFASFVLFFMTFHSPTNQPDGVKTYSVNKINGSVSLTGYGDDPQWKNALELTDFSYPWENIKPQATTFKALHNDEWVYFLFEVTDNHIVLADNDDDKAAVASSSRAEIFLRIDERLAPYYCLELDPRGRVLDYQATYHRKFNAAWSWPKADLQLKTSATKTGYFVEFALSKASLRTLGLLKDEKLQAGLFRADCLREGQNIDNFKWVSWVKPDSKTPDFHIPSSFGVLLLED
jgi:hypothetical protein